MAEAWQGGVSRVMTLAFVLLPAGMVAAGQSYTISTFAGNGLPPTPMPARNAPVWPRTLALDRSGNLYFSSGRAVFEMDRSGILTRIAGSRGAGPRGDGEPATSAHLNSAGGVAVDSASNVYLADSADHCIRRVSARGIITTIAGNGTAGYSGDNGPATRARLNRPDGIALDRSGNLYIADSGNNRVRKVTPNGIIRTVAGNGSKGHAGDHGQAVGAQLNGPTNLALDPSGNLYIADCENQRIRKVTLGGEILTIAGVGAKGYSGDGGPATSAKLNQPCSITTDSHGGLYITDYGNDRIRKVTARGTISTVAGDGPAGQSGDGGPATKTQVLRPSGVAVAPNGDLYIADATRCVRLVKRSGGVISTVAGNGQFGFAGDGGLAVDAQLSGPWSLAIDSGGSLYFSDFFNSRVRKITPDGRISTVAGNGDGIYALDRGSKFATDARVPGPQGIAVDSAGDLYIADTCELRIRKVVPNGTISTAKQGVDGGGGGLALDAAGNLFASARNCVLKMTREGSVSTIAGTGEPGYSGDDGPAGSAQLNQPWGLAVDSAGNLYIADSLNGRIRKVNRNSIISTVAGSGKLGSLAPDRGAKATEVMLSGPQGVAVDSAGNVFIADSNYGVIRKVARDGTISTIAGNGTFGYSGDGGPATRAQFNDPGSIVVGRDGRVYVADYRNDCIRVLTPHAP